MPWRIPDDNGVFDPYKILVSEIMLQQTQVDRVREKYLQFIHKYPSLESLSRATFEDVLRLWSGLGYNRRAKYLYDFAVANKNVSFPNRLEELVMHKGIGRNTAAAVLVYSFNMPVAFIETNIRTVFTYHFFKEDETVNDALLLIHVQRTIDSENPREWYWALMDYGSFLKKNTPGISQRNAGYRKQSKFEGSTRQLRGRILRILLANGSMSVQKLQEKIADDRYEIVLKTLVKDSMIKIDKNLVSLQR